MRPIDADRLKAVLQNIKEHLEERGEPQGKGMSAVFACTIEVVDVQPTIDLLPNDPLTPDELRKMVGEPIWVERSDDESRWVLIRYVTKYGVATHGCGFLSFEDALVNWWPYRRKPEE